MAQPVANDQLPPGAFQPLASNWCHSIVETFKVDFEWTIHQYELTDPGSWLQSTAFPADWKHGESVRSWFLGLDDNGVYLYQKIKPPPTPEMRIRVKTAFVNAKREKVLLSEVTTKESSVAVNSTPRETRLAKSKELIVNGALTIYCEIEAYENRKSLTGQTAYGIKQPWNEKKELLEDFVKLFENMEHSDVTFNVRGQEFPSHKNILATRSPVFSAMFQHPSKEKMTGVVYVPDIEPNVFNELLRFIYTGDVPLNKMDEVAVGLLAATDKYLLEKLKKACGDHLVNKMSPKICVKLLSLEENNPAFYLMEKAVDYIRKFPGKVMATEEWKKASEKKAPWIWKITEMLLMSFVLPSKAKKKRIRLPFNSVSVSVHFYLWIKF